MESCQHYVVTKQSNLTHWHLILGWFAQKIDPHLQDALPHVKVWYLAGTMICQRFL